MMRIVLTMLLTVLLCPTTVLGFTEHVVQQDGSGDFMTIQGALAAAVPGDRIVVGPGTYAEDRIELRIDLELVSEAGAEATILDGSGEHIVIYVTDGSSCSVTGFTLQNGYDHSGCGFHVDFGSSVDVDACIVQDNHAFYEGGAVFVRHSNSRASFTNSRFLRNTGPWNAGVGGVSLNGTMEYRNCWFEENDGGQVGGALASFANSYLHVENCVFLRNVGGIGGGVRLHGSPATIIQNTFYDNTSGWATITVEGPQALVLIDHNIIAGERSGQGLRPLSPYVGGCNLYYDNAGGDLSPIWTQPDDVFAEPAFCNHRLDDLNLCEHSPAASANSACGRIGAFDVECSGCGPVAVESRTWGSVKASFD